MNNTFVEGADGKPRVVRHEHVNLGLAVDVAKPDGSRTLVVPVLRDADTLDFAEFLAAYEELIRKVRTNKLAVNDFQRRHHHAHQPRHDRHRPVGAAAHAGPGRHRRASAPSTTRPSGRAPTSAPSASSACQQGRHGHVHLRPPHHPGRRVGPVPEARARAADGRARLLPRRVPRPRRALRGGEVAPATSARSTGRRPSSQKQMQVATLIRVHRVRGHLIADLDPLAWKEPKMHDELDPATYGLTIWDLDREFLTGGVAGTRDDDARRDPPRAARRVLPHDRHRVHAHPGHRRAALDPGSSVEGVKFQLSQRRAALPARPAERGRGVREVPRHQVRRHEALRARGRRVGHPDPRHHPVGAPPTTGSTASVLGMAHRGRLERAGQHRRQELRPDLPGVRGLRRPELGAGLGRREVPPRRVGQVRQPDAATTSRWSWPPTHRTSRPSTRWCSAWCGPARTRSTARLLSPCCRSSSTATPPSPARAWWPSAST